ICAKAKRQQQHGFICAKAKRQQQHGFICAKAKRQQQHGFICAKAKSDSNNNTQLNVQHHIGSKPLADVTDFEEELFEFTRKNPDTMTLEVINSDFLCF
ncbi:hypothetical protein, partial [Lysinibacillus sp. NPDC096215]